MAFHEDTQRATGEDAALIAYRNAHRLKKKGLISEVMLSLEFKHPSGFAERSKEQTVSWLKANHAR